MTDIEDVYFQAGDVIFDSRISSENAYFILEGTVELQLILANKSLALKIDANQFVGDITVAVNNKADRDDLAYRGRAIALEPVRAAVIPIADIQQELEKCPPLLKAWFTSFITRVLVVIEELSQD